MQKPSIKSRLSKKKRLSRFVPRGGGRVSGGLAAEGGTQKPSIATRRAITSVWCHKPSTTSAGVTTLEALLCARVNWIGLVNAVSSHESATFRRGGGHFCGRVARFATGGHFCRRVARFATRQHKSYIPRAGVTTLEALLRARVNQVLLYRYRYVDVYICIYIYLYVCMCIYIFRCRYRYRYTYTYRYRYR